MSKIKYIVKDLDDEFYLARVEPRKWCKFYSGAYKFDTEEEAWMYAKENCTIIPVKIEI